MAKNDGFEFEIIAESEIVKIPRGRKSTLDPKMVEAFRTLQKGQAVRIAKMTLDPKSPEYGKHKARVSATLRAGMRAAGHSSFSILFSPEGVPQVKLT